MKFTCRSTHYTSLNRARRFGGISVLFLLFTLLLSLSSCIGIESDIEINQDGSGSLQLDYRVSRMVSDIGRVDEEPGVLPLPIDEDYMRTISASEEAVELTEYGSEESSSDLQIRSRFEFDSLSAMNVLYGGGLDALSIETDGDRTVFRQLLAEGSPEPIDPDIQALIEILFADYEVVYTINAPASIVDASPGEITGEQTAEVKIPVVELLQQKTPLYWEVRW